ncbi:MAG: PEP-CTERM sorting domain-containing protein [Candidatus Didemnitutus sp.]|nr:PEP-CTERM sorting domain-containing protein [Candidatus Didemnitutus sp.]
MKSSLFIASLFAAVALSANPVQPFVLSTFDTQPTSETLFGLGSWNFSDTNQLIYTTGVLSVAPVSGGSPDDTGYFAIALPQTLNFTALQMQFAGVTAKIDSGNASNGFSFVLWDSNFSGVAYATFAATEFNQSTFIYSSQMLQAHPDNGNAADVAYFGIQGAGTPVAFRMSFDGFVLAAIPEPSTYAALLALAALGFVAYRRRFAVAA